MGGGQPGTEKPEGDHRQPSAQSSTEKRDDDEDLPF